MNNERDIYTTALSILLSSHRNSLLKIGKYLLKVIE